MNTIACVIVTYNRKELLRACLNAVDSQTFKPATVFIVDNACTDGTESYVKDLGFFNCNRNDVEYRYVKNERNEGGAGGFYLGLKTAFDENRYDAFWVMDDDGIPEEDCLQNLLPYIGSYHFLSPLVVDIENAQMTSFYKCSVADFLKNSKDGLIVGEANPFNGVLFSKELIAKIGLPKKELFIWGDEQNYMQRAIKAGFELCTVAASVHKHPLNRQDERESCFNKKVFFTESKWKLYCLVRNKVYNIKIWKEGLGCLFSSFVTFLKYAYYYSLKLKKPSYLPVIVNAAICGYFEIWEGQYKYMK